MDTVYVSVYHYTVTNQSGVLCGSMVDIQSETAEIRRGKKDGRKEKPQGKNILACPITQGGHNEKLRAGSQTDQSAYNFMTPEVAKTLHRLV